MAAYGVKQSGCFGSLAELGNAPLIIFDGQNKQRRQTSDEARTANILACLQIAQILRTSFGPRGLDKAIVTEHGNLITTNDGATILKHVQISHEVVKLLVELSTSQDQEIGDGTTGVILLAAALLEQALNLFKMRIHPHKVIAGYERACEIALEQLQACASPIDLGDESVLLSAARTSLNSKTVKSECDHLARIAVGAIRSVADFERRDVRLEMVSVEARASGELKDSALVAGLALNKEFSHCQMAKEIPNAKIAILNCPFEPQKPKTKHTIEIKSKESYCELVQQEAKYFSSMLDAIKSSGANVVFCQWGFDDEANHLLLANGIPAVRWVSGKEIEALAIATGGRIVSRFEDLTPECLGSCTCVREVSSGTNDCRMIYVEVPKSRGYSTVLLCGGNNMLLAEAKRALHDALCTVRNLVRDPLVLAGGGAPEIAVYNAVKDAALHDNGKDQFIFEAFAEAMLTVVSALAENSGFDAMETVSRVAAEQRRTGNRDIGVDCFRGCATDLRAHGVVEALASKLNQFSLATQMVKMILRIDDVILADAQAEPQAPQYF